MIYLDNAATTPMDPQVIEVMHKALLEYYGNASAVYSIGSQSRDLIEYARMDIAELLGAKPAEIFFTSGATESIQTILYGAVKSLGIQHIISSALEHPAMINGIKKIEEDFSIEVHHVNYDEKGQINLNHLEELLSEHEHALVSLMHVNNELGNLLPLKKVSQLCRKHEAYFFSDTVQSMGKFKNDLSSSLLDFAIGSAHKFHGPKGIGFMYINMMHQIDPMIVGGAQERNMRAGTENLAAIMGMQEAFKIAYAQMDKNNPYIQELKNYCIEQIKKHIPDAQWNGDPNGIHTILNIGLPKEGHNKMLVFRLDMKGIAVSGGSACSSGVINISHVIKALNRDKEIIPLRISFSKYNTKDEIDTFIDVLKKF